MPHDTLHRLQSLTRDDAENWIVIGRLLHDLETHSRADAAGRPWQDVIRSKLAEVGAPISPGHIYKIRRAIRFLIEHAPNAATLENSSPPKISAIEVAERLHRLDQKAGQKALDDVVGPNPVTYVELQKRYADALKEHPEMMSPRQLAWESRRKIDKVPISDLMLPLSSPGVDTPVKADTVSTQISGPSAALQKEYDDFLSKAWSEGYKTAEQKYTSQVSALLSTIDIQAEEISLGAQEIKDLEGEIEVLRNKILELRGDYSEYSE